MQNVHAVPIRHVRILIYKPNINLISEVRQTQFVTIMLFKPGCRYLKNWLKQWKSLVLVIAFLIIFIVKLLYQIFCLDS